MTATKLSTFWLRKTRDNGEAFYTLTDNAPAWLADAVRDAHGAELPDDWIHEACFDACQSIDDGSLTDSDDVACWADGHVDVYTMNLLRWLAGGLHRLAWCDEAVAEGLVAVEAKMEDRIHVGQFRQLEFIASAIVSAWGDAQEAEAEREDLTAG